jgi:hypothetical protein
VSAVTVAYTLLWRGPCLVLSLGAAPLLPLSPCPCGRAQVEAEAPLVLATLSLCSAMCALS